MSNWWGSTLLPISVPRAGTSLELWHSFIRKLTRIQRTSRSFSHRWTRGMTSVRPMPKCPGWPSSRVTPASKPLKQSSRSKQSPSLQLSTLTLERRFQPEAARTCRTFRLGLSGKPEGNGERLPSILSSRSHLL